MCKIISHCVKQYKPDPARKNSNCPLKYCIDIDEVLYNRLDRCLIDNRLVLADR